jgi:hypothetical protein
MTVVSKAVPERTLADGNIDTNYTGTVTFSTSDQDPGVVLPADYTFTADDAGVHTFTDTGLGETTLITPGDQTLTVTDTADDSIVGNATITVTTENTPWMGWGEVGEDANDGAGFGLARMARAFAKVNEPGRFVLPFFGV